MTKNMGKSVFLGRFFHAFMQFQDIEGHEFKSKIHSDLGFSEVTEACVTVIVFELPENRLRFQRPPSKTGLIAWSRQSTEGLFFLPHVPQFSAHESVFIALQLAYVYETAPMAVITGHMCDVAAESTF